MRITYEIITPESAEHGDAAERGFIEPRFHIKIPVEEYMADKAAWPDSDLEWSLTDAERFLGSKGMEDSGRWFTSCSPDRDYQTGAETYYSLHPANTITPASYARLKAIFCY